MRRIPLALIWVYQKLISPLLPPACRFVPSCSEYAKEAVIRHGAFKGSLLASWRLLRCQPLCRGGYDPVPAVWPDPQLIARIIPWTSRRNSA
ncbi:membrane protein insertion efficiency factor YidD [Pseudodesulfovibrio sp. zrk46]|uniref:membrane protein insertion efficiency factor YidD n=1 Tax=Pseudodesulfovibrio sp. zrk46 TaxID=2725288 RepID=UPI001449C255|nr:membrane protein insertion efficiency factor YidD [Pseudodesulfovibrio sp. zrk46]QJB58332.1 membrane protein insertion efficiency factor YidD [Pseudodesulfovibrio sp. zrk46]